MSAYINFYAAALGMIVSSSSSLLQCEVFCGEREMDTDRQTNRQSQSDRDMGS